MGYVSDVRGLIYGPPDDMRAFITKHKLLGNPVFSGSWISDCVTCGIARIEQRALGRDNDVITETVVLSVISLEASCKWYDDDPAVRGWKDLIDDLIAMEDGAVVDDPPISYEFICIGEEMNDIDESRSIDSRYLLSLVRSIDCDLPDLAPEEG